MAHILLIDDMKNVRRAAASVLKAAGHRVSEAGDGGEGIALIKGGQRFDLVITDMLMPEQDGADVIMFLETLPARPPVLAISGGGSNVPADVALMLAKVKADAVLAKPFDNSDLIATVDRLLG